MKKILLICVVALVHDMDGFRFSRGSRMLPPPPPETEGRNYAAVTEEYFTQKLDHFDPTNTVTWSQKYFTNDEYFDTVGRNVAFLMIEGEGPASKIWMNYGSWIASAKKYKAFLFQLEHRFYGDSQPVPDLSIENLRHLSSEQALGDLATFIVAMNKKHQLASDVNWILFGGSYAGSLAAWMRVKYPHLVQGSMSASAPILAKLDFYEYYQVVANDLAASSQECANAVKTAINQVETLLKSPSSETVTHLFNLCDPIEEKLNNILDVENFFGNIIVVFAAIAQYNNIPGTLTNVDDLCKIMTNKTIGTEVDRLAAVTQLYFGTSCIDYSFDTVLKYLKDTSIKQDAARQWYYQTCTEFGWYQTTNQKVPVFGNRNPIEFYTEYCIEGFGESFDANYINEQIERTNTNYGALDIETSNIVYVHGTFDPWHAAGLTKTSNPESPVILINGTSHGANFYEETADDLPELIEARAEVDRLIGVWLERDPN